MKKKYDYIAAIWKADADSTKANVSNIKRVLRRLVRVSVLQSHGYYEDDDQDSPTEREMRAKFNKRNLEAAERIAQYLIP